MPNCEKSIRRALGAGPMPLKKLRKKVTAALVAAGKDEEAARKTFAKKLLLPCLCQGLGLFTVSG